MFVFVQLLLPITAAVELHTDYCIFSAICGSFSMLYILLRFFTLIADCIVTQLSTPRPLLPPVPCTKQGPKPPTGVP